MGLLPAKIVPGENESLLRQEKLFQGKIMVERVSVNLNGPLEYDSEGEERPASPAQDSETLYALIFNVSLATTCRFCVLKMLILKNSGCKSLCGQEYFQRNIQQEFFSK